MAGSFATSLTTTWWDRREALHQTHLSESITAFNPTARAAMDQLQALDPHGVSAFVMLERTIVQQAYMLATSDLFWLGGWSYVVLVAVVWLARPPFSSAGAHSAGD
jgi:DHA2 family multidrug resistance protein